MSRNRETRRIRYRDERGKEKKRKEQLQGKRSVHELNTVLLGYGIDHLRESDVTSIITSKSLSFSFLYSLK